MLVSDVLNYSLQHIGAYEPGETPNANDQALALFWANLTLDSLSAKKLSPLGLLTATYALTGAASYTYGAGETWNGARPIKIKTASVIAANGTQKEAKISSAEEFRGIADLTRTGVFVENLFWDMGYPTGLIYVTPMPSAGNMLLETYQQILNFVNLADTVNLAPGFPEAVIVILALKLCFPFGRPIPDGLVHSAADAMMTIADLQASCLGSSMPVGPQAAPAPPAPKED
jgi:hypothetical protein